MPGRRAPEEERRAQILAAAFNVAAREGLARLTVRQVAAEARLSSGLVFFHFTSRDALLLALLDQLLAATPPLLDAARSRLTAAEQLAAVAQREITRLTANPA